MTAKDKTKFEKLFETEVHNRGGEIDPDNELDWYALTIGWAVGKGLTPKEAVDFSLYIRYHTNLG